MGRFVELSTFISKLFNHSLLMLGEVSSEVIKFVRLRSAFRYSRFGMGYVSSRVNQGVDVTAKTRTVKYPFT